MSKQVYQTDRGTDPYPQIARDFLRMKKVYRYHLKKIDEMDDRQVVQACHLWYTEHHCEAEYRAFADSRLLQQS